MQFSWKSFLQVWRREGKQIYLIGPLAEIISTHYLGIQTLVQLRERNKSWRKHKKYFSTHYLGIQTLVHLREQNILTEA